MTAPASLQATIHQALDALQFGDRARGAIVLNPVPCGLGGQVSGRVLSLCLALALDRMAVFRSLDDPPYAQTFAPLHRPFGLPDELAAIPLVDLRDDQQAQPLICYDPARAGAGHGIAGELILARLRERLGLELPSLRLLEGCILEWMPLTGEAKLHCTHEKQRLAIDEQTLGVHFRRGDKRTESAFVPAAELNHRIADLHRTWPFATLFLASDSPEAPHEIECPSGVRLIFDDREKRYNNANHKMLMASPQLAEQETRVAFKNIHLLSACGGVIGQDNAHFATLAAASIYARTGTPDRTFLIDGRIAERRSALTRLVFAANRRFRALGRRLFPFMTIQSRMKK